jgi:uncharacterized membrane protein YfcA
MMADPAAILTAGVLFLATLIRSALGFGEALVAVPLLALVMPVEVAAPIAVLVSITVALIVVVRDWREIHVRSAVWLVLPTLLGIPLGLILLRNVSEPIVKGVLAAAIIAFSAHSLLSGKRRELKDDKFAWVFGFGAGVLGGAYGMNGPPLAIYGSLRGWSPQEFRATLQGYFLAASLAGLWGYRIAGFWTPTVTRLYLLSLPLVVFATLLGRAMNRRMRVQRFQVYIHGGLMAVGMVLLFQAVTVGGPLLLRGGLQRGDVELHHLHHRSHRLRMLQELPNIFRHDLPAQAELVGQPAAGHGLATLEQTVPVTVDLGLIAASDGVRESRREGLPGATVEEGHSLAHEFDGDGGDLARGPGTDAARTQLAHLLRFGKDGEIELRGFFGVVVEPQKRCDLVHGLASIPMVPTAIQ